ncbi:MAG: benzoate/H(+) symporter BenE family transporter, partial [Kiloniellales bacterium]|nr:benzoate/H(+) symporter BenE family transporter [Kiloniellales bacterium]
ISLPSLGLPIFLTWFIFGRIHKLLAMPVAVALTAVLIAATSDLSALASANLWTAPQFVLPEFNAAAAIGIGLPLFIVTMASQNVPGIAVLNTFGYRPAPGPLFSWTGSFTLLAAPFGGHAVNLAAITAAICAGEDAHPRPEKRFWASTVSGICYVLFGLGAGAAVAFMALSPPILIKAVAGLALIGVLAGAIGGALREDDDREAAIITFLVTASGVTFFGIGGAFWGLVAGGCIHAWQQKVRKKQAA